jgi:hypothetical protein
VQFHRHRSGFLADLVADLKALEGQARKAGLQPACRLNGTSDLAWHLIRVSRDGREYANILDAFPTVRFYDYTKATSRAMAQPYSLTYSRAETTPDETVDEMIARGVNVAVVFSTRKGESLPALWRGHAVIDADQHDLRFLDPRGVICGLRSKGRGKRDQTGFVVSA